MVQKLKSKKLSKKIFIKTFGCQMNEYDSNRIYDLVSTIGFNKTDLKKEADCFVLNTCHIREKATEKVYHEIGRVKKDFKNSKKPLVIVSGCVAQAESQEMLEREPYIDMVIGPQSYHKIGDLILNYQRKKQKINETEFDVVKKFDELEKISNSQNKISSYLTIQEGVINFVIFVLFHIQGDRSIQGLLSRLLLKLKIWLVMELEKLFCLDKMLMPTTIKKSTDFPH